MRHWRQISSLLVLQLDPTVTTLLKAIALRLNEEENIGPILGVTTIAAKEYAVQMATEDVEKEVKELLFTIAKGPAPGSKVVRKIPEVNDKFDEFGLKISVLKTNPHIKNFYDRLIDLEKIVRAVVEILYEFGIFQQHWLYLQGIFSKSNMPDSLIADKRKYREIDSFYQSTTLSLSK
jgi:hypothetical protein